MRLVGYARVSIDCAIEDVLSLAQQHDTLDRWARAHSHRLVAFVHDEGEHASSNMQSRTAIAEALELIRTGEAEAMVVARLERLAGDVVTQELVIDDVRRRGGVVLSAEPADGPALDDPPPDPERRLAREVLLAVTDYASQMRDARVRYRMAKIPPDGDRAEAALARIEQLAEHGIPLRDISQAMTDEGFSPRFSHRFHPELLKKVIAGLRARRARV